ncbi:MAG: hypothetical protein K0R47_240 [Brevibacillus sp.]|nr:hypothetical protein [Brevibacillus sp.]
MPFTFAHPAIVLPLRESRSFHFPALIIGSMAPDFEYFFRMQAYSAYSHTILGVFYMDVPLVIGLWLLFARVATKGSLSLRHLLSGIVPFLSGGMITLIVLSWFVGSFQLKK